MSSIVAIEGTRAERGAIQESIGRDLHALGSVHVSRFFTREKKYVPFRESDVIAVSGEFVVRDTEDAEVQTSLFREKHYLSPDFVVVLEKPDTLLYDLQDFMPKTHAELGLVRSHIMLLCFFVLGIGALVLAFALGWGWWSIAAGFSASMAVFAYFVVLDHPIWASIGALRGALYIWWQVLTKGRSRSEYRELVDHLSRSDEPYLTLIHKILRHLI